MSEILCEYFNCGFDPAEAYTVYQTHSFSLKNRVTITHQRAIKKSKILKEGETLWKSSKMIL